MGKEAAAAATRNAAEKAAAVAKEKATAQKINQLARAAKKTKRKAAARKPKATRFAPCNPGAKPKEFPHPAAKPAEKAAAKKVADKVVGKKAKEEVAAATKKAEEAADGGQAAGEQNPEPPTGRDVPRGDLEVNALVDEIEKLASDLAKFNEDKAQGFITSARNLARGSKTVRQIVLLSKIKTDVQSAIGKA